METTWLKIVLASLMAQLVKNLPAMWETWFDPWLGKIPWRRDWLPTPVFWPGEFHGLYSPWGRKELNTSEQLSLHFKDCFWTISVYTIPWGQSPTWRGYESAGLRWSHEMSLQQAPCLFWCLFPKDPHSGALSFSCHTQHSWDLSGGEGLGQEFPWNKLSAHTPQNGHLWKDFWTSSPKHVNCSCSSKKQKTKKPTTDPIEKQAKDLNTHSSKEGIQKATKHIKRYSASIIIREMK